LTRDHPKKHGRHQAVREAFVLRDKNLGHRVVRGAGFTFAGILSRTLITLGSVAILARLLSPADFGYIAMATVITELAALFGNFGFAGVLIQKRVVSRLQMDTVFWASAAIGLALTFAVLLISHTSTWLFREPIAGEILRILSIAFVLNGVLVVHGALISRLMHFQADFWIELISIFSRAAIAVLLAWNGFGVWSLVYGALAGALIRAVLLFLVIPYWPRLRFDLAYLRSTWKTNSSYFAGGFLFYANSNFDLLLIGRSLGATALGFYQNARSLTDEVRYRMAIPLQRVLFPAFSTLQDNAARLQASVLRSGRLLAAIVFPVGIGIAAVADELVPVLYGEKWLAMIPVLKMLGISTAIKASTAIVTPVFNAKNRVGLALKYNVVGTLITLTSVFFALPWGINGVAIAIALSSAYSFLVCRIGFGLIGLGWPGLASMLAAPGFAAGMMWILIETSRATFTNEPTHIGEKLITHIILGALIYIAILLFSSRSIRADLKMVIKKTRAV